MGKTKKVGLIARALTCLAATAAIVLGTAFPAFAWDEPDGSVDTSNISVAVPTTIPCTMMADGTVVAPSDLTIVNSGDSVVVDAYTADAMGNAVDFTLDIGGTRALSRTGGKDSAPPSGIDFSSGSKELRLKVSKLDRKINAALMDKASSGGTDMLKLGFKFSEKALQGVVSISGDTTVGSTLTATTSNLQADAKPSYQWYRDGSVISGATGGTYTTVEADAGHEIICKVTDSSGRYSGVLTSNVITPVQPEPVAFAVFSADDNSLNFYKRPDMPSVGTQFEGKTVTEVFTGFEDADYSIGTLILPPWMLSDYQTAITSIQFIDKISPSNLAYWFVSLPNVVSIDLSNLDTSKAIDMQAMFLNCRSLTSLNLDDFDTSRVTDMSGMFEKCEKLTSLDLSGFKTFAVTDMSNMFNGCSLLTNLNLSGFDTSNVTDMSGMFYTCDSITELDLSSFDTSSVTNMKYMFHMPKLNLRLIKLGVCFSFVKGTSLPYPLGGDGKWYNSAGVGFTQDKIPSNVADTYTAWDPNLHGSVNITGDMQNGLKAKVSGAQSDAKLAFEWHRKRTVTDSFTWDIPMLTPAQRTISVGENAYIEVSMMDSNPVRNGYTIVVTGDSGEVYRQTFVELGTATIQIPPSGVYFLRIENTDPTAHTAYVRITSDKDSLIAGAASDSIGVSEAGDYYCVVTDTSGKYKGKLVSNTLTVR